MRECKNCGHEIVKRKGTWKHKDGGNYCKRNVYGKNLPFGKVCYCLKAEPEEKEVGK